MAWLRLFLWNGCALAVMAPAIAFGQSPANPPSAPEAPEFDEGLEGARPIRESGPPVTYLRNKDGKLILVPSLPLEEYERLMQLDRKLPSRSPPRYSFADAIELTGSVTDSVAELEARIPIRFTPNETSGEEWVRIPLRLNEAVLTSAVTDQDGAEMLTEFQGDGDGYIVWSKKPPSERLVLKFKFKLPMSSTSTEKRFLLTVPNWTTSIRLLVGSPDAEGRVDDESGCELNQTRVENGRTEFLVVGSGGSIRFSWRDVREPPPVLEAEGNVLVTLAGRGYDVEAHLRVRSFGPPIEAFTVRLPPGAKLLSKDHPDVEIAEVNAGPVNTAGQLVVVRRLEGKTCAAIDVRLRATAAVGSGAQPANGQEVSGFQVTGAQIQRGTIDFKVDGEWNVDWKGDANVRRVDVPEALRGQQVVARFEYDRHPYSLKALVSKGVPRINADSTYIVGVEAHQLKLNGAVRYRITGARVEKLRIDMSGWTMDRIGPAELLSGAWTANGTTVEIPLASGGMVGRGEFELQWEAHREFSRPGPWLLVSRGSGVSTPGLMAIYPPFVVPLFPHLASGIVARDISFDLPRPSASGATPGLLIVGSADNVELTPVNSKLRGLVPDVIPANMVLSTRLQSPLVYREEGVGEPSQFHGLLKTRRQSISVEVMNRIAIQERDAQVEQRFRYQIAFEPADTLRFEVPRSRLADLEVLMDGSPVLLTETGLEGEKSSEKAQVAIQISGGRLGPCDILFRHRIPHAGSSGGKATRIPVALARPVENELTRVSSSSLRLTSSAAIGVSLLDERLVPAADSTSGATVGHDLTFDLDHAPDDIVVATLSQAAQSRRSTMIRRVWIQSLLSITERRDRACFRLNTNEARLSFQLPAGADREDVTVYVDGQSNDRFRVTTEGEVIVELAESTGRRNVTIELWYWYSARSAVVGQLSLQAPALAGEAHADRVYWELRLPKNEHLVWASRNLVPEHTWRWQQFFLARVANLAQSDLEGWVHGSAQPDETGFNRYLFSSIGTGGPNVVVTTVRSFGMIAIAGSIFAGGAILLYFPWLRHPLLLLAIGLGLMVAAVSYPDLALAASQAVVIGLVLVVLARIIMLVTVRESFQRIVVRGSTYVVSDTRSSRTGPARAEPGSGTAAPAATVPAASLQVSGMTNDP